MKRYSESKIAVIASSLFTEGGDWRSIYFYTKHLGSVGESVVLIQAGKKRSFRQFLASSFFSPRIIVNGLGTCLRWPVLVLCLLRKDVRIYPHETRYMIDQIRDESPRKYRLLARIMRRNPILCVSRLAERQYRERFQAQRTHVVYECPGSVETPPLDADKVHIVMVGSINERKGADLFGRVADLAAVDRPDWRFHWVGALATMQPIYQSPNVVWHGWLWNSLDLVRQCDLFFLSSIDDPCPLAALEALQLGKRCIAYRETGTAELIESLPGCAVFGDHQPEAALKALELALGFSEPESSNIIRAMIGQRTGIEKFSEMIEEAMK